MSKAVLLIGPICSGKTELAKKLMEKGFVKKKSNYYSIEQNRCAYGNGLMSGEMFAWANFLQQIEQPPSNDNAIYEFSGTGRNVFNVSAAMRYSKEQNVGLEWIVVYCLAPETTIMERYPKKKYDAPMPYKLDDAISSLDFMNGQLKKSYEDSREWCGSEKLKFNMNVEDYSEIADAIMAKFK